MDDDASQVDAENLPDDPFIEVAAYDGPHLAVHLHTLPGDEHAVLDFAGRVTMEQLRVALEVVPQGWPVDVRR